MHVEPSEHLCGVAGGQPVVAPLPPLVVAQSALAVLHAPSVHLYGVVVGHDASVPGLPPVAGA